MLYSPMVCAKHVIMVVTAKYSVISMSWESLNCVCSMCVRAMWQVVRLFCWRCSQDHAWHTIQRGWHRTHTDSHAAWSLTHSLLTQSSSLSAALNSLTQVITFRRSHWQTLTRWEWGSQLECFEVTHTHHSHWHAHLFGYSSSSVTHC